jgi:hypothetical protein
MAAAAMLLAFTAGCGDDEPEQDTTTPAAARRAATAGEARAGYLPAPTSGSLARTLPDDYGGCSNDDGSIAGASYEECNEGSRLYTHDSRFFTEADGMIVEAGGELLDDPGFEKRSGACT